MLEGYPKSLGYYGDHKNLKFEPIFEWESEGYMFHVFEWCW